MPCREQSSRRSPKLNEPHEDRTQAYRRFATRCQNGTGWWSLPPLSFSLFLFFPLFLSLSVEDLIFHNPLKDGSNRGRPISSPSPAPLISKQMVNDGSESFPFVRTASADWFEEFRSENLIFTSTQHNTFASASFRLGRVAAACPFGGWWL